MNEHEGMTLIVRTVTRVMVWIILVYGFYIILHGHLTPGGGFGGGVILALAFLSVLLAFGRRATARWLNLTAMHETESAAVLFFLLVGIAGIVAGAGFLGNLLGRGQLFDLYSAGVIPLLNLFIGVKVAISLFVVLWMLAHVDLEKGDEP